MPDLHLPKFGGKAKGDIDGPDGEIDVNVAGPDVDVELEEKLQNVVIQATFFNVIIIFQSIFMYSKV